MCQTNDYSLLTANTGIAAISLPNPLLDGNGPMEAVITAGQNGTLIKSVIIKADPAIGTDLASLVLSSQGLVRLFIGPTPAPPEEDLAEPGPNVLYKEVPIPQQPDIRALPLPLPLTQLTT